MALYDTGDNDCDEPDMPAPHASRAAASVSATHALYDVASEAQSAAAGKSATGYLEIAPEVD